MAQDSTIEFFKEKAWNLGWAVFGEREAREIGRPLPQFEVSKTELWQFINKNIRKLQRILGSYYLQVLFDVIDECSDIITRRYDLLLDTDDGVYWTEEKNAAVMPHDRKSLLRQAIVDCYLASEIGESIAWHYSGSPINQFYEMLENLLKEFNVKVIKDC